MVWSRAHFPLNHQRSSAPREPRLGNCGRTLSEGIFKSETFLTLFWFQTRSCLDFGVSRTLLSIEILDLQRVELHFQGPSQLLRYKIPGLGLLPSIDSLPLINL